MDSIEPRKHNLSQQINKDLSKRILPVVIDLSRVSLMLFGGGLSVISICLLVSAAGQFITGKHPGYEDGFILSSCIFWTVLSLAGGKLAVGQFKERVVMRELAEEQSILDAARSNKGTLSIAYASLACHIRIAESRRILERLAAVGICLIDVSEEGQLIYRFPTFESIEDQKRNSL